jgi:hypothetical protein
MKLQNEIMYFLGLFHLQFQNILDDMSFLKIRK